MKSANSQNYVLTYRQLVSDFESAYDQSGVPSEDSGISTREIIYTYHKARALVIHRDIRDNPNHMHRDLYQTIGCVPLESEVPVSDCPCGPIGTHTWKRTQWTLPLTISNYAHVVSVGNNLEHLRDYNFIEWQHAKYIPYSRLSADKNRAYFTHKNRQIYFLSGNRDHEQYLSVTGVFHDPLLVYTYPDCSGVVDPCISPLDREVVMDPSRFDEVFKIALQELVQKRGVSPLDVTDDNQPAAGVENKLI